jgi:tetratricopeptide (TPR) repeat protein/ssDNA-binding Zn-finger/Zn-ribbon topoisomerase 1
MRPYIRFLAIANFTLLSIGLAVWLGLYFSYHREVSFSGGANCIACHQQAYRDWRGSDHDLAMARANDSTVLGDFANREFVYGRDTTRFFRRDSLFIVRTPGRAGKVEEFTITHTFGVRPLQQYLIPFPGGRLQCLPIAWDSDKGRWFQMAAMVYDSSEISPNSWLYWTNQAQNWNGMCAECHSTDLQKRYDPATDSFQTTWSDINVNCEACHGPGSRHLDWAAFGRWLFPRDDAYGLVVTTSAKKPRVAVEACAPCHARRSSLTDLKHREKELLDYAIPNLPMTPLYHADGQIREEVYVYGSFTQSLMYRQNVTCSNCHNPHSLQLKVSIDEVCDQCHAPAVYASRQHHFHSTATEADEAYVLSTGDTLAAGSGGRCVTCHMPGRYYMGIDYRRDHSFRSPRPDLSATFATPNACNDCHRDKDAAWAAEWIRKWYGPARADHPSTALILGARGSADADTALLRVFNDQSYSSNIRATALSYLAENNPSASEALLAAASTDSAAIIRHTAIRALPDELTRTQVASLQRMLNDSVRAIRQNAAARLHWYNRERAEGLTGYAAALAEHRQTLDHGADFPLGRLNRANYFMRNGDKAAAISDYQMAIKLDSLLYPAYLNLAILLSREQRQQEAAEYLRMAIRQQPQRSEAYYNLGLLMAEQNRLPEAAELLAKAILYAPGGHRTHYNLGLIYQQLGEAEKAGFAFARAIAIAPQEFDYYYAVLTLAQQTANQTLFQRTLAEMQRRFANDQRLRQLLGGRR